MQMEVYAVNQTADMVRARGLHSHYPLTFYAEIWQNVPDGGEEGGRSLLKTEESFLEAHDGQQTFPARRSSVAPS